MSSIPKLAALCGSLLMPHNRAKLRGDGTFIDAEAEGQVQRVITALATASGSR